MGLDTGWKSRLWLFPLLILPPLLTAYSPDPLLNLNLGNLPDTSFSCEGKVVGGYYADIDTKCQMFHVCTLGQKGETQDIKFLCLQGTVFDQETRVCERTEEVVCADARKFYDLNKELYQNSNSAPHEYSENVTDSTGEASVASVLLKLDSTGDSLGRYPSSDYTDDFSVRFSESGPSRRTTSTRSDVPLFSPRRTEQRQTPPSLERQQPFSRFRQTRLFTSPSSSGSAPTSARLSVPSVPLIPISADLDRPRLVITNGKPFVPKLSAPDPKPAHAKQDDFPSLTLPDTNFTCEAKVSGGHYADPETGCRMFHICVIGPSDTITDYKFLCGSSTAFEQKSRTCQEIEKIDCASSVENYYVNDHLIIPEPVEATSPKLDAPKIDKVDDYVDYYDYYFDYPDYTEFSESTTPAGQIQQSSSRSTSRRTSF